MAWMNRVPILAACPRPPAPEAFAPWVCSGQASWLRQHRGAPIKASKGPEADVAFSGRVASGWPSTRRQCSLQGTMPLQARLPAKSRTSQKNTQVTNVNKQVACHQERVVSIMLSVKRMAVRAHVYFFLGFVVFGHYEGAQPVSFFG